MSRFNRFASLFRTSGRKLRKRRDAQPWSLAVAAEVCEERVLLSGPGIAGHAAAPTDNVNILLNNGNIALQDSDGAAHTVDVTRSGNNLVFTGENGTTLTFQNGPASGMQTVSVPVLRTFTANLGAAGGDTLTLTDVSVAGAITINGSGQGPLDVELLARQQAVVVGGAIRLNSGGQQLTFAIDALSQNFTVNGAVQVLEGGGAQVHNSDIVQGSLGGHVLLRAGLAVADQGTGISEFDVLGGVTIDGTTTFDAHTTLGQDLVNIQSISPPAQAPVFNGAVNLLLGNGANQGAFDATIPILYNGTFNLTSGRGGDTFVFADDVFKQSFMINSGSNPAGQPDSLIFDEVQFDGMARIATAGAGATVALANDPALHIPTVFQGPAIFVMTGPSSVINAGQPSASAVLDFNSILVALGGNPFGTLHVLGGVRLNRALLMLMNFKLVG